MTDPADLPAEVPQEVSRERSHVIPLASRIPNPQPPRVIAIMGSMPARRIASAAASTTRGCSSM